MAKRPPPPPPDPTLNAQQIRQGIDRLQRRITDLEKFEPTSIKERWAPETKALETSIGDALSQVFGNYSSRYRRFQSAANLDHGGLVMGGGPSPLHKVHHG
jgi:hypothetical protein